MMTMRTHNKPQLAYSKKLPSRATNTTKLSIKQKGTFLKTSYQTRLWVK